MVLALFLFGKMDNYNLHKPVLLKSVLENLRPQDQEIFVDGTFGAGGYSSAILHEANCQLYAFDRDQNVVKFANQLKDKFPNNFHFIADRFSHMEQRLNQEGIEKVDGIVLDLGVSSMQLDESDRGFSFNSPHKLDMRMDRSQTLSAFEVINYISERELVEIIRNFGEEPKYHQIAKKIVAERQKKEIFSALDLANIIRQSYGNYNPKKIDPATKTFQAIRIFVNNELGELKMVLDQALNLLKQGGRLLVVSFHSLEDSYVKNFMRQHSGYSDKSGSRYDPKNLTKENKKYPLSLPLNKSIKPTQTEIGENIRARSARLRIAIKN